MHEVRIMSGTKYPECEKQAMAQDKARVLSDFLDFIRAEGIHLAKYKEYEEEDRLTTELEPCESDAFYNELLGKFFGIDLKKLEEEQRQMLDEIRKNQPR